MLISHLYIFFVSYLLLLAFYSCGLIACQWLKLCKPAILSLSLVCMFIKICFSTSKYFFSPYKYPYKTDIKF